MSEIIIEVHTITSADGWCFSDNPDEHVTCFALVSTHDSNYPSLMPSKRVIALGVDEMDGIVGQTISSRHTSIERVD